jgi:hypothetical protein
MFLPGLPADLIRACYTAAPGNELAAGKFDNRRSSAALAANTFGFFLARPCGMPALPGDPAIDWPPCHIGLEARLRFPWPGGRLPRLDAMIVTSQRLIGVESRRFEPFRTVRGGTLSQAYSQPIWGRRMTAYEALGERLRTEPARFRHVEAAELLRLAFGLRTAVHLDARRRGLAPVLLYLYAEPPRGPDGRVIPPAAHAAHRAELAVFGQAVAGDEVAFQTLSYRELLVAWRESPDSETAEHAAAVIRLFAP